MTDEPALPQAVTDGDLVAARIGARVRRVRMERRWTVRELALRVGMAPDVVADIERGVRLPTIGILHRLAAALRVGAGELLPSPLERPRVEVHLPVADGARSQTARVIGGPGDPTQTWLLELLPEEDGGGHDAHAGDELLVVEEGEVLCAFEGRKDRRVVAGRSLAIDPGVPHRLRAGESGPARFLVVRTDAVEG